MHFLLENLNKEQKEAVLQTKGPVMAIAGAGSGKTSVLTRRIAYLIYEKNVHFKNILAITFTNKAANEMKERVRELTDIPTRFMWISTFHSMCARILREHIELIGYTRAFQILDDDDTLQLVKSIMKRLDIDSKIYKPRQVKSGVQAIKADEEKLFDIEEPLRSIVKRVFSAYQDSLKQNNLVDFDDLLLLTIQLLKEHNDIRDYYRELFQYVLVDEFQDTNNVQYDLVKLLVGDHQNLFIVGDEDQSIYAFRGANIENIKKFQRDFPDYHLVLLEQNYRSTNTILKAANQVIHHNNERIEKNLYSTKGDGEKIVCYKGVTARDEVEYVAMKILEMVRKDYTYNDFAILYRANSTSRMFEDVFMQKRIPYRIFGNTSFFKRMEIKDFTAYLRLIMNPDDMFSFTRVISVPRRGIGGVTIERIQAYINEYQVTLQEAIEYSDQFLSKSMKTKLQKFFEMIHDMREKLNQISLNDFVDYVLHTTGYLEYIEQDDKSDVRIENLLEFKTILTENEALYESITKEELMVYLLEDISLKSEESQSDIEDGVTLMTLHAAKGLEFPVVFMVTMENGMFPMHRSFNSKKELEEERRLMYVGVTRAKEKLFFTNASVRQTYGETMQNPDSMFLKEISPLLLDFEGYYTLKNTIDQTRQQPTAKRISQQHALRTKKRTSLTGQNKNDLNKGDKVHHKVFGDGVVVSVASEQCVIAFKAPHGIKTLLKDHPAISKV